MGLRVYFLLCPYGSSFQSRLRGTPRLSRPFRQALVHVVDVCDVDCICNALVCLPLDKPPPLHRRRLARDPASGRLHEPPDRHRSRAHMHVSTYIAQQQRSGGWVAEKHRGLRMCTGSTRSEKCRVQRVRMQTLSSNVCNEDAKILHARCYFMQTCLEVLAFFPNSQSAADADHVSASPTTIRLICRRRCSSVAASSF